MTEGERAIMEVVDLLRSEVAGLRMELGKRKHGSVMTTREVAGLLGMRPRAFRELHVPQDIRPIPGHQSLFHEKDALKLKERKEALAKYQQRKKGRNLAA